MLEASGQFKVGDWLNIGTASRQIRIQCAGFPLVNRGRPDWVTITVLGSPLGIDVHGLTPKPPCLALTVRPHSSAADQASPSARRLIRADGQANRHYVA